jgi:hypothetical protein
MIESAKLNGLNPQHYLADVLARIADHPARRIAELLPWNWYRSTLLGCRLSQPAHRALTNHQQPPTAFETHIGRSDLAAGTAVHAPYPTLHRLNP